jgi:hypothetical protein
MYPYGYSPHRTPMFPVSIPLNVGYPKDDSAPMLRRWMLQDAMMMLCVTFFCSFLLIWGIVIIKRKFLKVTLNKVTRRLYHRRFYPI